MRLTMGGQRARSPTSFRPERTSASAFLYDDRVFAEAFPPARGDGRASALGCRAGPRFKHSRAGRREGGRLAFRPDWLKDQGLDPAQCRVISVAGEPTLPDRCVILVDLARRQRRDGRIFILRTEDGLIVKRAARAGNRWVMESDHAAWGATCPAISPSLRCCLDGNGISLQASASCDATACLASRQGRCQAKAWEEA